MNLSKIYVWSIALAPLTFFTGQKLGFGFALNASRLLQMLVLFILVVRFIVNKSPLKIPNIYKTHYKYYVNFSVFSLISGIFGILYGAYLIPGSSIEETINISLYRPILEYIIMVYQFFYFVILFKYIVKTRADLNYFFKIFTRLFYLSLIIGFIDLVLMWIFSGYGGLPRHAFETEVGFRFHGLFGEPRDAFGFLILGFSVLWLKGLWLNKSKSTNYLFFTILVAIFLTKSTSGLIGLVFTFILMVLFYINFTRVKNIAKPLYFVIPITGVIFLSVSSIPRVGMYYDSFFLLYESLSASLPVSEMVSGYINNAYPIWHRWIEILNLKIIPLLFGTGLGTSSVINNIFLEKDIFVTINPNSNLIRMLYDVGIVGVFLLIMSFLMPIKKILILNKVRNIIMIMMIFILGAYLAHRSISPFIFLGLLLVVVSNLRSGNKFV
jgi:hypothetical protein